MAARKTTGSPRRTRAAKGANHKRYSLSSPPCVIPSKSYLLAATALHTCASDVCQHKKVHFPRVLSSAPPIDQHIDCAFLSCSCPKCAPFKNSKGLWLIYGANNPSCQKRAGCKCAQCRKFYTLSGDKWDEVSASHHFLVHSSTLSPYLQLTSTSLYNHILIYTNPQTSV